MSRPLRIEYPGAWYHIMNRGRRGENIFESNKDRQIFIALLKESATLWNVRISAYCLMTTHYHILAQTQQGNLSRFMRHLNGVYTQRYNSVHGYDGQLFRGRFKSILIEEDSYLIELVRYIHRNPLRAGMVGTLDEYAWSSHQGYLSRSKTWAWLYKDFILTMLTVNHKQRKDAYLRFIEQENANELLDLFERPKWPSMLGSENFIALIKETYFDKKKHRQIPESIQLAPDLSKIKREVCQAYGVAEKELLTAQRGRINEPRNVAIYLCRVLRNDTLIELGRKFGMSGYSPAGSVIERVKKKLSKDEKLLHRVNQITDRLLAK